MPHSDLTLKFLKNSTCKTHLFPNSMGSFVKTLNQAKTLEDCILFLNHNYNSCNSLNPQNSCGDENYFLASAV